MHNKMDHLIYFVPYLQGSCVLCSRALALFLSLPAFFCFPSFALLYFFLGGGAVNQRGSVKFWHVAATARISSVTLTGTVTASHSPRSLSFPLSLSVSLFFLLGKQLSVDVWSFFRCSSCLFLFFSSAFQLQLY